MKIRNWSSIIVSIVMLVLSGYLLADSSVMSLDLLSNPNLNVAIELIRLFWGIVGLIYFLYYLYKNVNFIFFKPTATKSSVHHTCKKERKQKRQAHKLKSVKSTK